MSESISQNPKLIILTALITAITSIAVSVVGIFPQLHRGDDQVLQGLRADYNKVLAQLAEAKKGSTDPGSGEKWNIGGKVVTNGTNRPLRYADVVLIPQTGNNITTTGNDGSFEFSAVPVGIYSLVVRVPDSGSRIMIPQKRADGSDILAGEAPEAEDRISAYISYKINKP